MLNNTKEYTIITDNQGKILSIENSEQNPIDINPEINYDICSYCPIFVGIYPVNKDVIFTQAAFNKFNGSITLIPEGEQVKIIFSTNPKQQKMWQQFVQKRNQERLIKNIENKSYISSKNGEVLSILGFMKFAKKDNNFHLIGNIPQWFKALHPNHNYSSNIFHLEEIFPFLEVFLPEAEELYKQNSAGRLISGLWTEITDDNKEMILQATAIKTTDNRNLLLIESIFDRNPDKRKYIQRVRELNLEHKHLQETESVLRDMLKSREQFISVFSHDIKNPITGVATLIDLLVKDEEFMKSFQSQHQQLLRVIKKELNDLLDYSEKLYEWSNVNFSTRDIDITSIDIIAMFKQLFASLDNMLVAKKICCKIDIPGDIQTKGDKVFLKSALHNILVNAIKFSHTGGTLSVSAVEKEKETIISIKDQGIGMNDSVKKSLFNYSERTTKIGTDGERGTGIGLSIVKRIIDMHNGKIEVESEKNKGTTISLHLPL